MSFRSSFEQLRDLGGYLWRMGPRWTAFRVGYEVRRRTGYFGRMNERIRARVAALEGTRFPLSRLELFGARRKSVGVPRDRAEAALEGRLFAFSSQFLDYARSGRIDWGLNPLTGKSAPSDCDWNRIPDFGPFGDIKTVWEASRFPQVVAFIDAWRATGDERFARGCIEQILDWCRANPFPQGPNHKCGQEISFRIFAWAMALAEFRGVLRVDEEREIGKAVYAALLRVDANLEYATESVRNNHGISEACGLILGSLLCEALPERDRLYRRGMRALERELAYQVFADGSYIQHSFNYQRLVLDTLSFLMIALRASGREVPAFVVDASRRMTDFLSAFVRPESGWLPNYGANDGANLFPLGVSEYRDYRPSLNLASVLVGSLPRFEGARESLEFFGVPSEYALSVDDASSTEPGAPRLIAFPAGGYYALLSGQRLAFLRSHAYATRPGQCDLHHVDVWDGERNLFCDAGSFSYGSDPARRRLFDGAYGHNVLVIDGEDPMRRVLKFGWANWLRSRVTESSPASLRSEIDAYGDRLEGGCSREVRWEGEVLRVIDRVRRPLRPVRIEQCWLTPFEVVPVASGSAPVFALKGVEDVTIRSEIVGRPSADLRATIEPTEVSNHYLRTSPATRIRFAITTNEPVEIRTEIRFSSQR